MGGEGGGFFRLEAGDTAVIVAVSDTLGWITVAYELEDSEKVVTYGDGGSIKKLTTDRPVIVGPCRVYPNQNSFITFAITRASDTGSKTLAWNGTEWEGSSDDSQQANNGSYGEFDPKNIKYDEFLGWVWFTNTNWVYSYKNLSWYYMHPTNAGIMVWNANLPNDGWLKLDRG